MIKAGIEHRGLIVDILSKSFADNLSVNYITKSNDKKSAIRNLMDYSFEVCFTFGDVYLSDDLKACALVLYPDQKKTTLKAILLDIKLIFGSVGIGNIFKAISREKAIKSNYPDTPIYYLWFIGVVTEDQQKGIGSKLLNEIIADADQKKRPIYLETSTQRNLAWYEKFGFSLYNKLEFGYTLFLFRR